MNKTTIIASQTYAFEMIKKHQGLHHYRFKRAKEVIDDILGSYSMDAYYHFMKERNVSYEIAKLYLKHCLLVEDIIYPNERLNELVMIKKQYANFLSSDRLSRGLYQNVLIPGAVDPFLKKALEKYDVVEANEMPKCVVYEFNDVTDEVVALANEIAILLEKGVKPENIKVNNPESYYYPVLKEVFAFYNIDIMDKSVPLIANPIIKNLYMRLNDYLDLPIEEAFPLVIENNTTDEAKDFLNVLNRFVGIEATVRDIITVIEEELKSSSSQIKYTNCIQFYSLSDLFINDDDYLFLINFNQDILPRNHKNTGFLDDSVYKILQLPTTLDLNKDEKRITKRLLAKAYFVSFSKKSLNGPLMASPFIKELGLSIKKYDKLPYSLSRLKYLCADYLDDFYTYGAVAKSLPTLASFLGYEKKGLLHSNDYRSYDHRYNGKLKPRDEMVLSYTAIDKYYKCAFRFYIENIMGVKKPFDDRSVVVGNFFHYLLENDGDIDLLTNEFLKNTNPTPSLEYYFERMKDIISSVREYNKFSSDFKVYAREESVSKTVYNNHLVGKIDKILVDGDYACVVDYKTGGIETDLSNVFYGLNMQLPFYWYFLKDKYKFGGAYYQTVLPTNSIDDSNEDKLNDYFKWQGYSNLDVVRRLDNDLSHIKGIKLNSSGDFSKGSYNRSLDSDKLKLILDKTEEKINEAFDNISKGVFPINPKKTSKCFCEYCSFKDICFRKSSDIITLEKNDWLGDNDDSNKA